jgi:hypothetical protein
MLDLSQDANEVRLMEDGAKAFAAHLYRYFGCALGDELKEPVPVDDGLLRQVRGRCTAPRWCAWS